MPSESSPKVCNAYAQTGSCRFGSQCKFAHVERVNVANNNNKKRRRVETVNVTNNNNKKRKTNLPTKRSGTQTPLDDFFAKYPKFEYNSSASASLEFYRMCDEHSWHRDDEEREKASRDFKDAIVHQFNHFYGSDADNLTSWHTLCQIVQVSPIPDTLESCREAVKATYVNIVDLIDTGVTEGSVTVFVSEVALSEYTKRTGKIFPRDNVNAGGLLKYLLRRIVNPRPERHVSESGRKKQSRRKR